MCEAMLAQPVNQPESSAANVALVRLLPGMDQLVVLHRLVGFEPGAAHLAAVQLQVLRILMLLHNNNSSNNIQVKDRFFWGEGGGGLKRYG